MDILMVSPELAPFHRGTAAADSVAALAKALSQLDHRVTVAVPHAPGFAAAGLLVARRLTPLELPGGGEITVLDGQLPASASLVLFDAPGRLDAATPYPPGESSEAAAARAGLFCRAAVALAADRAARGTPFDLVHVHDWPAAAVVPLLRALAPALPTVLTIHDGSRRGDVPAAALPALGLDPGDADLAHEATGVSLLALAARDADAVIATSPTVAAELADPARHGVLARVLGTRAEPAVGIAAGLDYALYNPATDAALRTRFDAEDARAKNSVKSEALRRAGLDVDPARPLVVALVPAGDAGAAELVGRIGVALVASDTALLVVVEGDRGLAERLAPLGEQVPDRIGVELAEDGAAIRRALGAATVALLAATDDPSGAAVRIAQRYGAVPVARARGAAVDAIVDADAELETGTGFLYDEPHAEAVLGALGRALAATRSPRFASFQRRILRLDLAWDRPARRHVQIYRAALAARDRRAAG